MKRLFAAKFQWQSLEWNIVLSLKSCRIVNVILVVSLTVIFLTENARPLSAKLPHQGPSQQTATNPLLVPARPDLQKLTPETAPSEPNRTNKNSPNNQRVVATKNHDLVVFGYSYFEPARMMIDSYRSRILDSLNSQPEKTQSKNGDTIKSLSEPKPLTATERQDLNEKYRQGKLTPDEQAKYRQQYTETGQPIKTPDESSTLSDAAKVDLLLRQRDNKLTKDEAVKYRGFLAFDKKIADRDPKDALIPGTVAPALTDAFRSVAPPLGQILQNISATVPANYQISGGDKIDIRISSPVLETREFSIEVDSTGSAAIPEVGKLILRGQTLAQVERTLQARFVRLYRGAQVSVSIRELRTMPVTITGDAYSPGTYQVPAVVSLFNMIYATGGPTVNGSLRQIVLIRQGKPFANIDFYAFLITGNHKEDITLEPGDVIYFPGYHSRISVIGEVRRPAIFETLPSESLYDILRYAGGVKPSGLTQHVQVATVAPGVSRTLKDVDISKAAEAHATKIYDGDTVEVFSVRDTLTNVVTIEGAVDQPGQFAISPHMTIADLVERSRGLLAEAYPTIAHLYRWNSDNSLRLVSVNLDAALKRNSADNLALERWDRLVIYTRQEISSTNKHEVTIKGAVQNPKSYYRSENMRVRDLVLIAGGLKSDAYTLVAFLLHQRPDGSFVYDSVNLDAAARGTEPDNALIQDRDILAVYTNEEAKFTPDHSFEIRGEVLTQGRFPRGQKMRLSEAIMLAGGLTPRAGRVIQIMHSRQDRDKVAVEVQFDPKLRTFNPNPEIEDGDSLFVRGEGNFVDAPRMVEVTGAVNHPGPIFIRGDKMRISDVIKEVGGLMPDAFAEGAEFVRKPNQIIGSGQIQIAQIVSKVNDILNQSDFKRALAMSDVERLKAIGSAAKSSLPIPLLIPGIPNGVEMQAPNSALSTGTSSIFSRELVSPPRVLTDGDLQPVGNVAINMVSAIAHPGSRDDALVENGDQIIIPLTPSTVNVIGAVYQPRGVLYKTDAKIEYYLDQCGGISPDGARNRALVIRRGGGLLPLRKVQSLRPGDVILIPTQVMAAQLSRKGADIDTIFRNLTNSALIVMVAKKLLGL